MVNAEMFVVCSVSGVAVAGGVAGVSTWVELPLAVLPKREVKVVDRREGAFRGTRERGMDWFFPRDVIRGGRGRFTVWDDSEKVGNAEGYPDGKVRAGRPVRADGRENVPRMSWNGRERGCSDDLKVNLSLERYSVHNRERMWG